MNHLSLFSGSGIGTLAALQAGIETVAHAENDPACCYCLERLWPGVRLFRDVRDVTDESVADLRPVDIISGGFPCTDISTAGKGAGLGTEENPTRSGLWFEFARVIRETRPTWVLIENVPALRVRGGDRVTNDLEAMAYEWEAVVVGAWAVGAPHKRDRVWIVGRLGNAGCERRQQDARSPSRDEETHGGTGRQQRQQDGDNEPDGASQSRLADPIGNLCGRGGDEPQRGPEGRTAAGRAGSPMEHATRSRQPGNRQQRGGDGKPSGTSRAGPSPAGAGDDLQPEYVAHSPRHGQREQPAPQRANRERTGQAGDGELGNATSDDQWRTWCGSWQQSWTAGGSGMRWPARPGEPQHAWEAPRLVEFGVGSPANELARRVHERLDGTGNGIPPNKAASAANKSLLRMIGNAWVYELAVLMFQAILELESEFSQNPA